MKSAVFCLSPSSSSPSHPTSSQKHTHYKQPPFPPVPLILSPRIMYANFLKAIPLFALIAVAAADLELPRVPWIYTVSHDWDIA